MWYAGTNEHGSVHTYIHTAVAAVVGNMSIQQQQQYTVVVGNKGNHQLLLRCIFPQPQLSGRNSPAEAFCVRRRACAAAFITSTLGFARANFILPQIETKKNLQRMLEDGIKTCSGGRTNAPTTGS